MSIFNKITKTFQWGQHSVTLETGEIARQASGAVVVSVEGTVVRGAGRGRKLGVRTANVDAPGALLPRAGV